MTLLPLFEQDESELYNVCLLRIGSPFFLMASILRFILEQIVSY